MAILSLYMAYIGFNLPKKCKACCRVHNLHMRKLLQGGSSDTKIMTNVDP